MSDKNTKKVREQFIALCSGRQAAKERARQEQIIEEETRNVVKSQQELIRSIRRLNTVRVREGKQPAKSDKQLAAEAKRMHQRLRDHDQIERVETEISDKFKGFRVRTVEMDLHPVIWHAEPRRGKLLIVIDSEGHNGVAEIRVLPENAKSEKKKFDSGNHETIPLPDQLIKGLPEIVAVHRYDAAVMNCLRWAERYIDRQTRRFNDKAAEQKATKSSKGGKDGKEKKATRAK